MDVIAKLHPQTNTAGQEVKALKAAKGLLGGVGLRVPMLIGTADRGILLEFIEGRTPNLAGDDHHLRLCVEYLAGMARIGIPRNMTSHYHGAGLRQRLEHERVVFETAASRFHELSDLRADFEDIVVAAAAAVDSDPEGVMAHGDFQPQNLLVTASGELVPVDWSDFGRAHRGYEIANLLLRLNPERMRSAFLWYGNALDRVVPAECLAEGLAIARVIRAGGVLRQLLSGTGCNENSIAIARRILLRKQHQK